MRKTVRFGPTWAVACSDASLLGRDHLVLHPGHGRSEELPPALVLSPGRTVLVVNVLSKVTAFLSLSLFTDIIESLRWTLACRPEGVLLTSFSCNEQGDADNGRVVPMQGSGVPPDLGHSKVRLSDICLEFWLEMRKRHRRGTLVGAAIIETPLKNPYYKEVQATVRHWVCRYRAT